MKIIVYILFGSAISTGVGYLARRYGFGAWCIAMACIVLSMLWMSYMLLW